jgi:hypothetical protein
MLHILQAYVSSVLSRCCIYCYGYTYMFHMFRLMLQIFHLDIAKVYLDVEYVAIAIHACCKCFIWRMLQIFHLDVPKVDLALHMLQRRRCLADSGLPLPLGRCSCGRLRSTDASVARICRRVTGTHVGFLCGARCCVRTRAMALDEMRARARELCTSVRPGASPYVERSGSALRVAGLVQVRLRICRS